MIVPAESFDPAATLDAIETRAGHRHVRRADDVHRPVARPVAAPAAISRRCAPASCRAAPARSKSCAAWSMNWAAAKSRSPTARPKPRRSSRKPAPTIRSNCASKPSAGRLPGVEVKMVDPATGATLGDNQQGELCARGHVVMLGYYKNPGATARGHRRRRLAAHRRPGGAAAQRLLPDHRPDQRHGDSRRREHLIRARSRSFCSRIRRSSRPRWWACPIRNMARSCAPGSS